jgi:hypothetical protein
VAVTIIGSNPGQIEYRLGQSHACLGDDTDIVTDLRESPLIWVGEALADLGLTAGTELTEAQFDQARALLHGRHPGTGEQLVEHKLGIPREAKVPVAELLRQIEGIAREAAVPIADVLLVPTGPHAGKPSKMMLAAFERAQRLVERHGEIALQRADHAGALADAAGLDIESIWNPADYAAAVANLTKTVTVVNPDGSLTEEVVPNREIIGNFGYDAVLDVGGSLSGAPAIASPADSAAMYRIYQEEAMKVLGWLEKATAYGMRGHHGDGAVADTIPGNGFAGWAMIHRTARPVGGAAIGDPHWHVHFTLANMTMGDDGRWSTIAAGGRDLMRHLPVANKLLQAQIRHRLTTELGIRFERSARTGLWEIAAFPDTLIRLQSKRTQAIDAELRKNGYPEPGTAPARVKKLAQSQTREAKAEAATSPDETLRQYWRKEALRGGLDPELISATIFRSADRARSGGYEPQAPPSVADLADALQDIDTGLTSRSRRFSRLDAIGAVAEAVPGGSQADIEVLADSVLDHAGFVKLEREPEPGQATHGPRRQLAEPHMSNAELYTTRDIIDAETVIVRAAEASHDNQTDIRITTDAADMAAAAAEQINGFPLSGEQWRELIDLTTSGRQLDALIGGPGAGKTTLMDTVRSAYETAGFVVAGTSTQGVAAQTLQAEAGIGSRTVAQWLWRVDHGPGLRGIDVLILDEAGMTNDRDRARLYLAATDSGTKIIEVGDPRQLRGVGCGSMFATVHRLVDGGELVENRRQADTDERAAIAAWRRGDYSQALTSWADRDRLIVAETGQEAISMLLATWVDQRLGAPDSMTEIRGLLIVAATNEQVGRLNDGAQAIRLASGELGEGSTYALRGGGTLSLHEGDLVLIRANERQAGEPDALNGYRGVVTGLHSDGRVSVRWERDTRSGRVTEETTLRADFVAGGGLGLGYAVTIHKSQGLTVGADSAHWTGPDGQQRGGAVLFNGTGADNPGTYVAVSRHKYLMFMFLGRTDIENLHDEYLLGIPKNEFERTRRVMTKIVDRARATETNANDRPALVDLGRLHDPGYEDALAARTAERETRRAAQEQRARQAAEHAEHRVAAADLITDLWGTHIAVTRITEGAAFDTIATRIHELAQAGGDPRGLLSTLSSTAITGPHVTDASRIVAAVLNRALKDQHRDNEHPPLAAPSSRDESSTASGTDTEIARPSPSDDDPADSTNTELADGTPPGRKHQRHAQHEADDEEQLQRDQVADLLDEAWTSNPAVQAIVDGSAFGAVAQNLATATGNGHDPLEVLAAIDPGEAALKNNPSAWVAWKIRAETGDHPPHTEPVPDSTGPPGSQPWQTTSEDPVTRLDVLVPAYQQAVARLPRQPLPAPEPHLTPGRPGAPGDTTPPQRGPAQAPANEPARLHTATDAITAVWTDDASWIVERHSRSMRQLASHLDDARQAGYDPEQFLRAALRGVGTEGLTPPGTATPGRGAARPAGTYSHGIPHPGAVGADPAGFAARHVAQQLAGLASLPNAPTGRPARNTEHPDAMWPAWLPLAPTPSALATLSGRDKAIATGAAADARRIRDRVVELGRTAAREQPDWVRQLGPAPTGPAAHARFLAALTTLAAYREQHGITGPHPLGPPPADEARNAFDTARRALEQIAQAQQNRRPAPGAEPRATRTAGPTQARQAERDHGDDARRRAERILDQQRSAQQGTQPQHDPTHSGPEQGPRPGM